MLFIGRLTEEKQPLLLPDILLQLRKRDERYRLVVVGTGKQSRQLQEKIQSDGFADCVTVTDKIPNAEIWQLYRMADAFVNLNRNEIFGMAILEAMYYGCKVVALHAPGPDFIIENGKSGWLADDLEDAVAKIMDERNLSEAAHNRILRCFTWQSGAKSIMDFPEQG